MDTGESKKTEAAYVVSSLTGNIVPSKDSVIRTILVIIQMLSLLSHLIW